MSTDDLQYMQLNPLIIPYYVMWTDIRDGKITFSQFVDWMQSQEPPLNVKCIGTFENWNGG